MIENNYGGRNFLSNKLPFEKSLPSISIITVTYNALQGLRETFTSISSQTYKNIEYIVVDGDSNDKTVDFLRTNDDQISYWITGKDAGIYDAMNKGALAATGDWIIFMNSGDIFFGEDTLAKVVEYLNDSVDVVYGGVESIVNDKYGYRTYQRKPYDLSLMWREIPTCHQSVFVRKELQIEYPFDTCFIWCADHDFLAKLYVGGYRFQEIPAVICKFDASGGMSRDLLSFTRERWSICRRYFGKVFQKELYFVNEYKNFWFQKTIISKIRNLLPTQWIVTLRKYRGI